MSSSGPSATSKRIAAERALDFVRPGMRIGLGTGSTVEFFLGGLGKRIREGLAICGVPTSERTRLSAAAHGVPLRTLEDCPELDLTVDGADEFDPQLRLIKGGGGALLREKIVAAASARMIVIADSSKMVERLGRFPLPVEVAPFGAAAVRRGVEAAAARARCRGETTLRMQSGHAFVTDGGHHILDCAFGSIPDPDALALELSCVPGVLGHGLFIGMADAVIMAEGSVTTIIGEPG